MANDGTLARVLMQQGFSAAAATAIDQAVLNAGRVGLVGYPATSDDASVAVTQAVKGLKTITLDLSSTRSDAVDAYNTAALNAALSELYLTGGVIDLPNGGYFKTGGHVARADIFLQGRGESAPIIFEPTVDDTTFMTWIARQPSGTGTIPRANSELNIEKAGFINLTLEGNRAVRANAFDLRNCDHGYVIDSTIKGMKGFSVRLSRCREMRVRGLITRYNGYCDPANIANCVSNIIVNTPTFTTAQGINNDTSNLSQFSQIQAVFSFWHEVEFNGAPLNGFSDFLIHGLPRGNASVEVLINTLYGGSGTYSGGLGWDANGTPKNEYAALHAGGASVANVAPSGTPRRWGRSFPQACGLFVTGTSNLKVANGRLIGGGSLNCVRATASSSVAISSVDISAAGTGVFSVTAGADTATDTFTIDAVSSGTLSVLPETGTTIELSGLTTSPAPFILGRKGYLIRVSDTQFKIASTYANAIAGTAIDITSAGSGLTFKTGGELLLATSSSQIAGPQLGEFDDARVIARADETSTIRENISMGSTFSDGPLRPTANGEIKLFAGRNINMNSTADTALLPLYVGYRYAITKVVVVRTSGGTTTNNTVGGVYTAAAKGGTAVVDAATTYSNLNAQHKKQDIDPPAAIANTTFTGQTMYWAPTTAAGADMYCDVHVYGRIVD